MSNNSLIDLTGMRFGKLLVLKRHPENSKSGNARWICKCDCGNESIVIGSKLRSQHTKSCGCNKLSDIAQGHSTERLYRIWIGMKNRCYKKNNDNYKWYGAKGITICKEWLDSFISFREWALDNGYNDDLSIDRIDNDGSYSPKNCRWVTMKFQANNKTNNRLIQFRKKSYTVSELSDLLKVPYWTVVNQRKLGWDIEKIAKEAGYVG